MSGGTIDLDVLLSRADAIRVVADALTDQVVVTANGHVARELHAVGDRPENFYMLGSMGLAAPIALGLAVTRPDRRVVVLDGDGNVLMGLGHLAMVGERGPGNLCHLVLDNESYASTGGQRAISDRVALDRLAAAAEYRWVERVRAVDAKTLAERVGEALAAEGPAFLLIKVAPGNTPGTTPETERVRPSPPEIVERVRGSVLETGSTGGAASA